MAGDHGVLTALLPIATLVLGWLLKVLSDRWSERMSFDHQLRLEKEYALYSDLWDRLFELRRAVGDLVGLLIGTNAVRHGKDALERFNAYQAVVRKGEPFMSPSVYAPAREIVKLARQIIGNIGDQQSLSEFAAKGGPTEAMVEKRMVLGEDSEDAFRKIENLFQEVATAIRHRVYPEGGEQRKAIKVLWKVRFGKEGCKHAPPYQ